MKSYFDYVLIISKVLKDKCWHSFKKLDMFETVDRIYPDEDYSWWSLLNDPSYVIDRLYLGSAFNAADFEWLKDNDIELVVNATSGISNFFPDDFEYQNYEVEDLKGNSLSAFYEHFYQLMATDPERNILIHCYAGRSRSASLVVYYLAKHYKFTVDEAIAFLKERRPIININKEFIHEIKLLLDQTKS